MQRICGFILISLVLLTPLSAQTGGVGVRVKDISGEIREIELYKGSYALVIGNSRYTNGWDSLAGVAADVAAPTVLRSRRPRI